MDWGHLHCSGHAGHWRSEVVFDTGARPQLHIAAVCLVLCGGDRLSTSLSRCCWKVRHAQILLHTAATAHCTRRFFMTKIMSCQPCWSPEQIPTWSMGMATRLYIWLSCTGIFQCPVVYYPLVPTHYCTTVTARALSSAQGLGCLSPCAFATA